MTESPLQSLNTVLQKSGGSIRMIMPDELDALSSAVMIKTKFSECILTAILDDWSVVMLAVAHGDGQRAHLVGDLVGTTKIRVTSTVLELDQAQGLALTQSGSVYQLGTPREGEPDINKVLALARTITTWRGIEV